MKNKGFSLIEIIISIAVLAILFSFIFYFVTTIKVKNTLLNDKPYLVQSFNYSDIYCHFDENQLQNLSIAQTLEMSEFISTSTPITGMHIFNSNKMIVTTDSASTSESDIFLFDYTPYELTLINKSETGPGITDSVLHGKILYVLNTSINSHIKSFTLSPDSITPLNEIKINELSASSALPKNIYVLDKTILIGSEKNNSGGELFVLPLDNSNKIMSPTKSIEIGGQVSALYANQNSVYVANASDTEMFVYDKDFNLINSYDAPLSLGNGKSVFYLHPYVYLGRTVASFELFFLEVKDLILHFIDKYKTNGSIDFIQNFNEYLLFIVGYSAGELQFYSKDMKLLKMIDIPTRVISYTCHDNTLIVSGLINNKAVIIWLK